MTSSCYNRPEMMQAKSCEIFHHSQITTLSLAESWILSSATLVVGHNTTMLSHGSYDFAFVLMQPA